MARQGMRVIGMVIAGVVGLIALVLVLATVAAVDLRVAWTINILALTGYACMLVWYFTQGRSTPAPTPPEPAVVAEPEATDSPQVYYDFKGDVHDVIDVEGIGEVYAAKLHDMGIETTARLCYEDAQWIADELDVPLRTVQKWQAMSQLAKINGIGKQYAEALVRAGVEDIDTLKRRRPGPIAKQVSEYLQSLDNNVLGQSVTEKRVQGWQSKAKSMRRVRQPVPEV